METNFAEPFEEGAPLQNTERSSDGSVWEEPSNDSEPYFAGNVQPHSFLEAQTAYADHVPTAPFVLQQFPFYQLQANPYYVNQPQSVTFMVSPPHNQPYLAGPDNMPPCVQFTPVYHIPNQNQLYSSIETSSQRNYEEDEAVYYMGQRDPYILAHQNSPYIHNISAIPALNHQMFDSNVAQHPTFHNITHDQTAPNPLHPAQKESCKDSITPSTEIQLEASKTSSRKASVVHSCKECGKHFKRKQSLLTHMNIHSNLRPFKCFICGKTFNAKQNYMRHERLHLQKRAYKKDDKTL